VASQCKKNSLDFQAGIPGWMDCKSVDQNLIGYTGPQKFNSGIHQS